MTGAHRAHSTTARVEPTTQSRRTSPYENESQILRPQQRTDSPSHGSVLRGRSADHASIGDEFSRRKIGMTRTRTRAMSVTRVDCEFADSGA